MSTAYRDPTTPRHMVIRQKQQGVDGWSKKLAEKLDAAAADGFRVVSQSEDAFGVTVIMVRDS